MHLQSDNTAGRKQIFQSVSYRFPVYDSSFKVVICENYEKNHRMKSVSICSQKNSVWERHGSSAMFSYNGCSAIHTIQMHRT